MARTALEYFCERISDSLPPPTIGLTPHGGAELRWERPLGTALLEVAGSGKWLGSVVLPTAFRDLAEEHGGSISEEDEERVSYLWDGEKFERFLSMLCAAFGADDA